MLEDMTNIRTLIINILCFTGILNIYLFISMIIFNEILNYLYKRFKDSFVMMIGIIFLFFYSAFTVLICYNIMYISK